MEEMCIHEWTHNVHSWTTRKYIGICFRPAIVSCAYQLSHWHLTACETRPVEGSWAAKVDILSVNQAISAHGVRWTTLSSVLDSTVVGSSPSGVCRGPGVLGKERLAMVRILVYVYPIQMKNSGNCVQCMGGVSVCLCVCHVAGYMYRNN